MPSQLEQLRTVLAAALHLPADERAAFVERQCPDHALRSEVEEFLELERLAGEFLNVSLPELLGATAWSRVVLPLGTLLKGRYRVDRLLAESGFATVYLAKDELLAGKLMVIKALDRIYEEQAVQEALRAELESLGRIHHPNIVGVSDVGALEDGTPFLVLTYVPGKTLREVLREGPVPAARGRAIIKGVGLALTAAHKAGVIHLDIKPENIILSDVGAAEERVTVIDFGIARLKSLPGSVMKAGSPRYMAPEQPDSPSRQCDIYSLAMVAFELSQGRLPGAGKTDRFQAGSAIARGLDVDPDRRFDSVADFTAKACAEPWYRVRVRHAVIGAVLAGAAVAGFGYLRDRRPKLRTPGPCHS